MVRAGVDGPFHRNGWSDLLPREANLLAARNVRSMRALVPQPPRLRAARARLFPGSRGEGCVGMITSRRCAQLGLVAAGVVLASSLGVLYAFSPKNAPVVVATAKGDAAPAFRLKDLEGHVYDSRGLRGKAVVVFFSSIHCGTCGEYQPRVHDLARRYHDDSRVQFLAMNQDVSEGDQQRLLEVRVFTKVTDRPFPTLLDVGARTAERFGARPAQFAVLDPQGNVRYVGGFDDNLDPHKVTRPYVADELRRVLGDMPTALAAR